MTPRNGTFDNLLTMTRQVYMNGILGLEIKKENLSKVRDNAGRLVKMAEWGSFPDYPQEEGATK